MRSQTHKWPPGALFVRVPAVCCGHVCFSCWLVTSHADVIMNHVCLLLCVGAWWTSHYPTLLRTLKSSGEWRVVRVHLFLMPKGVVKHPPVFVCVVTHRCILRTLKWSSGEWWVVCIHLFLMSQWVVKHPPVFVCVGTRRNTLMRSQTRKWPPGTLFVRVPYVVVMFVSLVGW